VRGRREFSLAAGLLVVLGSRGAGDRQIDITLIGERRMRSINREYKGRGGTAEILTFSYDDDPDWGGAGPAGEILICWKSLAASAARLKVSRRAYLLRLVAHGLSHLEGFSHGDDLEAARMEKREREFLKGMVPEKALARMFRG
jgi:probable rRNA maturation factor